MLERKARGTTHYGRTVFLDMHGWHCCRSIWPAKQRAVRKDPRNRMFAMGFLLGQEVIWLSGSLRILREEAPDVGVTLWTKSSPELATPLMQGKIDAALLRRETQPQVVAFNF